MAVDSKIGLVEFKPFGDFTSPETLDERGLRHFIPMYISAFNSWINERYSDNRVRQAGAFDYYLRTAFERASALGLADDPELAKLREEYRIEHERVSHIL